MPVRLKRRGPWVGAQSHIFNSVRLREDSGSGPRFHACSGLGSRSSVRDEHHGASAHLSAAW